MRETLRVVSAAAAVLAAGSIFTAAHASELILGLAQSCAEAAKAQRTDHEALTVCSSALQDELLSEADLARTLNNRGTILLGRGLFAQSIPDFDRAAAIRPNFGEVYVNRGAARVGLGQYDEGLADLNPGLSLNPEQPEKAYYNRALAYEGLDDLRRAYLDYRRAAELKPEWLPAQEQLARFTITPVRR